MKERPILFSAPMVSAILEGRKTQTRRAVKKVSSDCVGWFDDGDGEWAQRYLDEHGSPHLKAWRDKCPYGQPGDRLWVRETWRATCDGYDYKAGKGPMSQAYTEIFDKILSRTWKPSIHMPRVASRILLEVTSIRVERLQDISKHDAVAEGLFQYQAGRWTTWSATENHREHLNPVEAYRELWQSINGPGSWDANPWVWVVEFAKVIPGEAAS